jgi:hypothetical protein
MKIKRVPSTFVPANAFTNLANTSVVYVILPYLSLPEITKLQLLNLRFYRRYIPHTISTLE